MSEPIAIDNNSNNTQLAPFLPYELIYIKLGFLIIIVGITFFFGLMPLFYIQCRRNSKLIGFANAFSGGLFMGIALFHLLPEANENFEKYSLTPQGIQSFMNGLPMAYFIAFASYSLILLLEKVAFDSHALTEHTHHHDHAHDDDKKEPLLQNDKDRELFDNNDNDNGNNAEVIPIKRALTGKREKLDMADEYFISQNTSHPHKNKIYHDCFAVKHNKKIGDSNRKAMKGSLTDDDEIDSDQDENTIRHVVTSKGKFVSYLHARNLMTTNDASQLDKSLFAASKIIERTMEPYGKVDIKSPGADYKQIPIQEEDEELGLKDLIKNKHHNDHYHHHKHYNNEHSHNTEKHSFTPTSFMTPYVLLIALSLHGLFEGTALGVMTKFRSALFLSCAILAHKWAESFALGISFFLSGIDTATFIKMITLFASFTPLGILIGIFFSGTSFVIQAVLLSISSGTFIYISASEVIIEEFAITKYRYQKYFCYLLGGILVGALKCFEVEE